MHHHQTDIKYQTNLDSIVQKNFEKVNLKMLVIPTSILFTFFSFFAFFRQGDFIHTYVASQKELFLGLNHLLSSYPNLEYNISYLGDALVLFPFVFIFLCTAPKLWEALLKSSVLTLIIAAALKFIFAVPRPAATINMNTFTIMGRPNILHTSLPSGHSMTAFMFITILLYAFMPKKRILKLFWTISLVAIGLTIAFSRVAIGAHYPFDVVIGCDLGYIMAILGISIYSKRNWLSWMKHRRFYPIVMLLLSIWAYLEIVKLVKHNMVIFYLSLLALIATLIVILNMYVKERKA